MVQPYQAESRVDAIYAALREKVINRHIFENEACLVINKSSGESSQSPDIETGQENFPVPVHRLDMPVSGCLLLAKTPGAAAFLGSAFAEGRVQKRYWAIVEMPAEALPPQAELVHWISENKRVNKSFASPWTEVPPSLKGPFTRPKKAVLRYRLAGKGERYLFLEIDLVTGRHHQIRSQLAAVGIHVKGDLKYGARRSEKGGGIRLHARFLAFPNPLKPDEIIEVTAPLPVIDALWAAFETAN